MLVERRIFLFSFLVLLMIISFVIGYVISSVLSSTVTNKALGSPVSVIEFHRNSVGSLSSDRNLDAAQSYHKSDSKDGVTNTSSRNIGRGLPGRTDAGLNPGNSRKSTGSSQEQTLEYEFVISHYNEGLDWLRPIANHSHVYHKGNDKKPPFEVYKWETLPNVGREAHTYLYHIIQNYDNLTEISVFLQGHGPNPDAPHCFPRPMDFVENAKRNKFCVRSGNNIITWDRIRHIGKWLKELNSGKMRKANLTLGGFYEAVFGTQHPPPVAKCHFGCFSATRENLRRHPTSFYQNAMAFLVGHSNPEEAHYMERLWRTIISG